MLFQSSMSKVLAARGYQHCKRDEEFTRHGDYARHVQYAFSKEFKGPSEKIVDIIFLSADLHNEKVVIGFFRENISITNGVIVNTDISIPLAKFTLEEFEKQLDRIIPRGLPFRKKHSEEEKF
jgi:hypothetical protein